MGSMILLEVGGHELDSGKNEFFLDHSPLFQNADIGPIEYRYVSEDGSPIVEQKEGYRKSLSQVSLRLDLLGFCLRNVEAQYGQCMATDEEYGPTFPSFAEFAAVVRAVDLGDLKRDYLSEHCYGHFVTGTTFPSLFARDMGEDAPWRFAEALNRLHPWAVLRLLAQNPRYRDAEITWGFADVVENGWVDRARVVRPLDRQAQYLLVTEGSSDAAIIKKALALILPHVADLFYFVNMEDGFPFTGTGNLFRFCQGLAGIGVLNNTVFVYDNDTEGISKRDQSLCLDLPPNIGILALPDLDDFCRFDTAGPHGHAVEDINGKAAAIECYLDLRWHTSEKARVRWTSYNDRLGRYQGELLGKEQYARRFLSLTDYESHYDTSKLRRILEAIISECMTLSTRRSRGGGLVQSR